MNKTVEKFEDLGKRLHIVPCRCSQCGRYPVLVTRHDEMGYAGSTIECECGLRIPVVARRLDEMLVEWERINAKQFTPSDKPRYVGKPSVCMTCFLKNKCTEFAGLKCSERMERRCPDWIEEDEEGR